MPVRHGGLRSVPRPGFSPAARISTCIAPQGNKYDNSDRQRVWRTASAAAPDPREQSVSPASGYAYTAINTSSANREWLRTLPAERRVQLGPYRVLLCHGSPRRTNEFLWESTTSSAFLEYLLDTYRADVILATHTGIHWQRRLARDRHFVNAGVLGRPENDGAVNVWYVILSAQPKFQVEFVPVHYDHKRLAAEMHAEKLPEEFIQTILSGWWTTCLEILPAKERSRGPF